MTRLLPITIVTTTRVLEGEVGEARGRVARACIASWLEYLHYDGELHLHIADDGSSHKEYSNALSFLPTTATMNGKAWTVTYSRQERKGVGASLNAGFAAAFKVSPLAMYVIDDWELVGNLNLNPWAEVLSKNEDVGCIRLAPSGGLRGGVSRRFGPLVAIQFERHAYYWSMIPALYHKRFVDAYGPFVEGIHPRKVEDEFNRRICSKVGPEVLTAFPLLWRHAGEDTSWWQS